MASYGPAYAGIGSRKTPKDVLKNMTLLAKNLAYEGYVLRSGHADGADKAFEKGAKEADRTPGGQVHGLNEIYLQWGDRSGLRCLNGPPKPEAFKIAQRYHPNWAALSDAGQRLQARNSHIALGWDLDDPVKFVLCWTPNGAVVGGTGQVLRMAADMNIPVFNMASIEMQEIIKKISKIIHP